MFIVAPGEESLPPQHEGPGDPGWEWTMHGQPEVPYRESLGCCPSILQGSGECHLSSLSVCFAKVIHLRVYKDASK